MKLFRKTRKRFKKWQRKRWYNDMRSNALFRASNGEHLPARERKEFNLPDWTA